MKTTSALLAVTIALFGASIFFLGQRGRLAEVDYRLALDRLALDREDVMREVSMPGRSDQDRGRARRRMLEIADAAARVEVASRNVTNFAWGAVVLGVAAGVAGGVRLRSLRAFTCTPDSYLT